MELIYIVVTKHLARGGHVRTWGDGGSGNQCFWLGRQPLGAWASAAPSPPAPTGRKWIACRLPWGWLEGRCAPARPHRRAVDRRRLGRPGQSGRYL